jgi:hypothetical protein
MSEPLKAVLVYRPGDESESKPQDILEDKPKCKSE